MVWLRRKRTWLVGAGILVLAGTAQAARRTDFRVIESEVRVPGLAAEHDGLVVAHLSDFHVGLSTPDQRIRRAVELVNSRSPDLILLTGDYVTFSKRPLKRLGQVMRGLEAPTFAVLGNHDHWVDPAGVRAALESAGYHVLRNESVSLEVDGAPVFVAGVDDSKVGAADVHRALADLPRTGTRLVAAHQPTDADQLPPDEGLVCFSGHTHGGQLDVPGLTGRLARALGHRYLRGMHRVRGNWLLVSAGLGYGKGGPALRLRVPPEVGFVTLRAG